MPILIKIGAGGKKIARGNSARLNFDACSFDFYTTNRDGCRMILKGALFPPSADARMDRVQGFDPIT